MDLSIEDIIKCTGGTLLQGDEKKICKSYSRDTRTINKGDMFIAIKGEKYDGNLFWEEALKKGADSVLMNKVHIDENKAKEYGDKCIIQVDDTIKALGDIARFKRNLYKDKLKVIAVTGSVGKTSTKDVIASVISKKYKTLKTEGNKNNNIGLPLTILNLKDEQVAVIEIGMNHFGEISYLTNIAKPDLAVITNIGTAHIGNLGSRENILKAKLEILEGMRNKRIIINNDNDLLNEWNHKKSKEITTYTFGIKNKSDVNAENVVLNETNSEFLCKYKEFEKKIEVPVPGENFILNSLCAFLCGMLLNLTEQQIAEGIRDFRLTAKRMEIVKLRNNVTLINDSYNASLESMNVALSNLKNMEGKRKIAVLGDMFELGDFAEKLHREVGNLVYKNNVNKLFLVGKDSKYIGLEAEKKGFNKEDIFYFDNVKKLTENLKKAIMSGDVILIKASNGMKLFEVAESLKID